MKEMFLSFELSKKLKAKGFACKYPFAMYNELGQFCPLFTSSDKYQCKSGYQYREYFDFDDFDEHDVSAPTIEQALKWLREEKNLHIEICINVEKGYLFNAINTTTEEQRRLYGFYKDYESAAIAAIEYVVDYLI